MKDKLPEGWEIAKSENVLEAIIDYRGKTPKKSDTGIPTLSAKSVKNNFIDYENVYYISKEEYNKFMVRGLPKIGDVVITTEAPLGMVTDLKTDTIALAQRLLTIRGKKDILNNKYLKYYFQSAIGQHELNSRATGTTVIGISQKNFRNCKVVLPPLSEQGAIASTLSVLDDKIELNNRINVNLEAQAQALFKHWFVDFEFPDENGKPYKSSGGVMVKSELGMIPERWAVHRLDEVANITMGQSPKGTSYNENGEGMVFYQGRTDFSARFPRRRLYTTEPNKIAKKGDILMSVRAPVGDINIANEDCCIGRGLSALNSTNNLNSFLLYAMKQLKDKYKFFNAEGTVFGSITLRNLKAMQIIQPSADLMKKYDDFALHLDEMYLTLDTEARVLSSLRDILLPVLMSGKLRISSTDSGF